MNSDSQDTETYLENEARIWGLHPLLDSGFSRIMSWKEPTGYAENTPTGDLPGYHGAAVIPKLNSPPKPLPI